MTTSWTLVLAAPLAQVTASVEALSQKPALSALSDDATVARIDVDARDLGALAFELRGALGNLVDTLGPEGIRAVESLDTVTDLASARRAPGAFVTAPPTSSFDMAAAVFGARRHAEAPSLTAPTDLSDKLGAAMEARSDHDTMESRLRATRGIADWGGVFGATPEPKTDDPEATETPTEQHDAMRDALRAERPVETETTPLAKSEKRRALEDLVRRGGDDDATPPAASATPEGKVG